MSKDTNSKANHRKGKNPRIRLYLKQTKNSAGESRILAAMNYRVYVDSIGVNRRIVYSTGKSINPKYWDSKRQVAKESVNYVNASVVNEELKKVKAAFLSIRNDLFLDVEIDPTIFKNELEYRLGKKKRPVKRNKGHYTLYEFIEKLIEKRKKGVDGKHGQTWQKFRTVYNHLKSYADEYYDTELNYDDITISFKDEFVEWLRDTYNHSENTIAKTITVIKQFLTESTEYHSNMIVVNKKFTHKRVKVPKEYPTLAELEILAKHEFKSIEVQNVIDRYLISAFGGGLRWSDNKELSKDNVIVQNSEKVIQVFTYKGRDTKEDNEVVIPILPQLQRLIDKYDWKFPTVKYKDLNDLVREGFKEAELNRQVLLKSGIKGEKPVKKKLHEVVYFHTSRYAYINFMINDMGVSAEQMLKITGQSLKILLGYERGDKKQNAVRVAAKINDKLRGLHILNKVS